MPPVPARQTVVPVPDALTGTDIGALDQLVQSLAQTVDHLSSQVAELTDHVNRLQSWADQTAQSINSGPLKALEIDGQGDLLVLANLHVNQGYDLFLD